jgi:hypothetical protein
MRVGGRFESARRLSFLPIDKPNTRAAGVFKGRLKYLRVWAMAEFIGNSSCSAISSGVSRTQGDAEVQYAGSAEVR